MADLPTPVLIAADKREVIPVELVGERYSILPPKTAVTLKMAVRAKQAGSDPALMYEALQEWIDKAFGKKAKEVHKRLDDPDDLLDIEHITELMKAVIEVSTGNPTS